MSGRVGLAIFIDDEQIYSLAGDAGRRLWADFCKRHKTEILEIANKIAAGEILLTGDEIQLKCSALETGTAWRPSDPWFLRRQVADASMDEVWWVYWLSVLYVGEGMSPEAAMRQAVADVLRSRKLQ